MMPPSVLYSAGSNGHGQLSNGTIEDSHIFQPCGFKCGEKQLAHLPINIQSIDNFASGGNHTLLLLNALQQITYGDGAEGTIEVKELWGCGDGSKGQLGLGQSDDATTFRPISISTLMQEVGISGYKIKAITASWETSYIVLTPATAVDAASSVGKGQANDLILSMGADDYGDLGIGNTTTGPKARGITTSGRGRGQGTMPGSRPAVRSTLPQSKRTSLVHLVQFDHVSFNGRSLSSARITINHLQASQHHVVACLEATWDGNGRTQEVLVGWGACRHGQLGSTEFTQQNGRPLPFVARPVVIPMTSLPPGVKVKSLALGSQHTLILYSDGLVEGLGTNRKGQLQTLNSLVNPITTAKSIGDTVQGIPIALDVDRVGCTWNGSYFLVIDRERRSTLIGTGSNTHGQLGRLSRPPSAPAGVHGVDAVVDSENDLSTPGCVHFPEDDPGRFSLDQFACGSEHALALFTTNLNVGVTPQVWGWGWNEHGNLGKGDTQDAPEPVLIWPMKPELEQARALGIWAGCGTSWVYCVNR